MSDSINIEVGGIQTGFERMQVKRTMEALTGGFKIETSNLDGPYPIKIGQSCKILVNGVSVLNGFVEKFDIQYKANSHILSIYGRDKTCDVIDSTLGDGSDITAFPITLKQLTEKILSLLNITNIKVIDDNALTSFKEGDIQSAALGESAFDFLERCAKKRQVLLTTDGDGNIVFTRATSTNNFKTILSSDPTSLAVIKTGRALYDNSKRFNKYIAKSQTNFSAVNFAVKDDAKNDVNVNGTITDTDIRASRIFNFPMDLSSQTDDTQKRAEWERNFRKSQGSIGIYTVQGFEAIEDGKIWAPNHLVRVEDHLLDMHPLMLISEVTYHQDGPNGSVTMLKLLPPDAFKLLITKQEKNKQQTQDQPKYFETPQA